MKLILGSMTFGDQVDSSSALQMLRSFRTSGHGEVDTAYHYNDGDTESMLGDIMATHPDPGLTLATKVNPWNPDGLAPDQVRTQFNRSLERLGLGQVEMLYLHAPDLDTPIRETLQACNEFYSEGRFERFGLSNYAAWQVAEVVEICRQENWMVPSVYQGLYNAINRDVERELLPCLRNYGIAFYAYNPLAGGMLTGKHKDFSRDPEPGRFEDNDMYRQRYWKSDHFEALAGFTGACGKSGIPPAEAALRWMTHHSMLDTGFGDGIILGASRVEQLAGNLDAVQKDPLPGPVLDSLDSGWQRVKADCYPYFRT